MPFQQKCPCHTCCTHWHPWPHTQVTVPSHHQLTVVPHVRHTPWHCLCCVIKLLQFSANPSKDHFEWAKYICQYLIGTKDYTMVFDGAPKEGLIVYSDSNWAVDLSNCCSITGYFFKLAGSMVSWLSRAQKTVALIHWGWVHGNLWLLSSSHVDHQSLLWDWLSHNAYDYMWQ